MPELLKFSLQSFTAEELSIKVKNACSAPLAKTLVIELYPPAYLVSAPITEAAKKAPTSEKPVGSMRLDGIVSCPAGWSVWARRESSDSSLVIVLINDVDQNTGEFMETPVTLAADAEFTIRIPLNPEANRANTEMLYSYLHGTGELAREDGKLELKSGEIKTDPPDVTLTTDHTTPTAVKPGDLVKVIWHIKDGVSATLRGPLPGGNNEMTLGTKPDEIYKIGDGWIEIRVVGPLTFVLQAKVKRPTGPDLQVVRMLSFDTTNHKYSYVATRPDVVLPYGLVEIDWAAWGVKKVTIDVGGHTTRVIPLTQQTMGRFYEGAGVMRVSASKTKAEAVILLAPPLQKESTSISVSTWHKMTKPEFTGVPLGMAVLAPYLGLLTTDGLFIARVGVDDPSPKLEKLPFTKKEATATQWYAIAAVGNRFVCLRRVGGSPDLEIAAFTPDGKPDVIPPLTLHADLRLIIHPPGAVFDLVGFDKRAYVVVETPLRGGIVRRAYSVGFDSATKKADYRPEPMLAALTGYRLVTFDEALYALNRETGDMFRFESNAGRLGPPMRAASAVTRGEDGTEPAQSMVKSGLIVPVGQVLVVLSPNEVPSLKELEPFGLHNVLGYEKTKKTTEEKEPEPARVPQDLFYNPHKNYWGRCGHDLDVQPEAVAAYRDTGSLRMWVVQPDGETHTLAVSSISLFAHDYVPEFTAKPLLPYLNKKRRFSFKYPAAKLSPVFPDNYRKLGIEAVSTTGPAECGAISSLESGESVIDINYNEADPSPVTLRMLTARGMKSRTDIDYMLELTLSGPDLSTATSCLKRLSTNQGWFGFDEVFGSRKEHATNSVIEVSKPARFDEEFKFVIVNASDQLRVKTSLQAPAFIATTAFIMINLDQPDFTLEFEGKVPTKGVIPVNFNYALQPGIETSSGIRPQKNLIRLNTDRAQQIQVLLVKMLMPGDQPLKLKGSADPIEPARQGPVFVCHLDYKM
jgi:hypothetical protein